ncbi:hypothetical protein QTJ16_001041 [Diplocarpon rosae]|uniref:Uncharacterized protein n=1 Tax=Diplocarpon rosae TaxID=946125 RepID=A0AAD9T6S4_9HELO|nr:hypothetical protein QTJ16_001041 [Diplocarpon rosae]
MHSPWILFCALLTFPVPAAPYVVTSYVILSVYTRDGYTASDEPYTYSSSLHTRTGTTRPESLITSIYPVAAPSTGVSAIATLTASADNADVTLINIVLESGSILSSPYSSSAAASLDTSYAVPITYTPEARCSQNWTFTTNVPVEIPAMVTPTPVTLETSVSLFRYQDQKPMRHTEVLAILNPTNVASGEVASASSIYAPYQMSYCYVPTTTCATASPTECSQIWTYTSSPSGYNSSSWYNDYDDRYWLRSLILVCVLVPLGWILIWLAVGLLESWYSFKGLFLGLHRKRGFPYAWCCISVLFLCWVGPTYKAKSPEEQAVLLERWKAMKKSEKFKLWMKWGFRWKYPDVLGAEPELAKRAVRQGFL